MKTTPHIQIAHRRNDSEPRAARHGRSFPLIDQAYQSATLLGNCGTPAEFDRGLSFFQISHRYFADEAPRGFAVDTAVFAALILSVLLPIANGLEAVATLIHSLGVL